MTAVALLAASALVFAALELGHFAWLRRVCARIPVARSIVRCHFCAGFWAGLATTALVSDVEASWEALRAWVAHGLASAFVAAVAVPVALSVRQFMLEHVPPGD